LSPPAIKEVEGSRETGAPTAGRHLGHGWLAGGGQG
jgi:hypothetical protein